MRYKGCTDVGQYYYVAMFNYVKYIRIDDATSSNFMKMCQLVRRINSKFYNRARQARNGTRHKLDRLGGKWSLQIRSGCFKFEASVLTAKRKSFRVPEK